MTYRPTNDVAGGCIVSTEVSHAAWPPGKSANCYSEMDVRRTLVDLLLSLLLLTNLVWGGCISCEEYFMWQGAKSCCSPDGHCKTKTPSQQKPGRECKQIAVDHQKSVDLHVDLPLVAFVRFEPLRSTELNRVWRHVAAVEPSPPDLQVLHSTFLI